MKNYAAVILAAWCLLSASCNNGEKGKVKQAENNVEEHIEPGLVMVADSMPITEDPLNKPYFSVKLISTDHTTHYGAYKVVANWGGNHAESEFAMPRGGEQLKPVLRKGKDAYTYIIGFLYEDQPEFYDYYQVSAAKGEIKMKYIKAYSFK
jgi:hypothetical protein